MDAEQPRDAEIKTAGPALSSQLEDWATLPRFPFHLNNVSAHRFERLLLAFVLMGISSTTVTALLVAEQSGAAWQVSAAGCLLYSAGCAFVLVLLRKRARDWQLWFWAAFLVSLMYIWTAIFLVKSDVSLGAWIYWPVSLLIGVGAIPWGIREVLVVGAVTIGCGASVVWHLSLGMPGALLFAAVTAVSLLYSILVNRRIIERFFFDRFPFLLGRDDDRTQVVQQFIDSILASLATPFALQNTGDPVWKLHHNGEEFELLLPEDPFPVHRSVLVYDRGGISIEIISRLKQGLVLSDKRIGTLRVKAGILIRFSAPTKSRADAFIDSARKDQNVVLFFGISRLFLWLYRRWIRVLITAVVQMVSLRVSSLDLARLRLEERKYYQASRREWEYELSSLVHDTNNTVQDLMMLCDAIIDDLDIIKDGEEDGSDDAEPVADGMLVHARRIAAVARSISLIVSDSKRRRELERLEDLAPREQIQLREVVDAAVAFASIKAERKRIAMSASPFPGSDLTVRLSAREHLETILRSLLDNAIKVSRPGSEVKLSVAHRAGHAIVEVTDNGPGMSKIQIRSLLSGLPLGRSVSEISDTLAQGILQARRVIEAAGGTLDVRSPGAGKGLTVVVSLPCEIAAANEASTAAAASSSWALVVDDQKHLTDFYSRMANALRLTPHQAESVEQAIALVEEWGEPALVVTDLQLGERNGLELVVHLRSQFGSELPILVVSGQDSSEVQSQVIEAGATAFVGKPIRRQALFEVLQRVMASSV